MDWWSSLVDCQGAPPPTPATQVSTSSAAKHALVSTMVSGVEWCPSAKVSQQCYIHTFETFPPFVYDLSWVLKCAYF